MRPLIVAVLALLALAPACDAEPEVDRLEDLADNLCGEEARCMVEECGGVNGTNDEDDCRAECHTYPCAAGDSACAMAYSDVRAAAAGVYERCSRGKDTNGVAYDDYDCAEAVSLCDDVQDPMPS